MTRKRWIGVGCAMAVVVALVVSRGGSGGKPSEQAKPAAPQPQRSQAAKRAKRIDPRTQQHVRISGRVTDDAGAAIAGARVCSEVSSPDLAQVVTRAPTCSNTGTDGRYELASLLPGRHAVSASAAKYRPMRYRDAKRRTGIRLRAGEHRDNVDFALRGGGVLARGVVKDIGGGPIAGAQVRVQGSWRSRHGPSFGITDDKGAFAVWTGSGSVWVQAAAEGYAQGSVSGRVPGQSLEVLLTPESVIAGRVVVAGTTTPVAGAKVELAGSSGWRDADGTAFTDADGRFRVAGIKPGRFKPEATAAGFYGKARESVLLGLGETRDDVVIEVHRAFVVRGQLRTPDDKPCERGSVSLSDTKQSLDFRGRTDRDGAVVIKAVQPGTYEVRAFCDGYVETEDHPDVVVHSEDVTGLQWRVAAGVSIAGRVLDDAGKPIEAANVSVRTTGGAARARRSWANDQTGLKGRFELDGLEPGSYRLSAGADGYVSPKEPTEVEVAAGEQKKVDMTLSKGGRIEGEVVDQDGKPVPKVSVRAVGKRWGWRNRASTADDGTFTIEGLRAGNYRVTAQRSWRNQLRRPGSSDDDVQGTRVDVANGTTATVKLVVESQSGFIEGQVLDESGAPVADAFVSAQRESEAKGANRGSSRRSVRWTWRNRPVLTDTDGKFRVENLSDGKYTVRAFRRGGGEAFAESIPVGSTTAKLTIRATGAVVGTVALSDGTHPARFTVSLVDRAAGFSRRESFFRSGGEFALRDLPAGNFTLAVSAAEGTVRQEVKLDTGKTVDGIALVLESRVTIKGRVVSLDDNTPVPGIYVSARPVNGRDRMSSQSNKQRQYITDKEGRFTIENASAGRVYISCYPMDWDKSDFSFARKLLTVEGGGERDVGDVQMPRRRLKPRTRPGDLGFKLVETPPETEPEDRKNVVSFIRPGGPAERSGLKSGDEIVTVDGHDVRGAKAYLYWSLTRVAEGRTVTFGLGRGAKVKITAAKPL